MLNTYATPLKLEINPSKVYLKYVLCLFLLMLSGLFVLQTPIFIKCFLAITLSFFISKHYFLYNRNKTIIWHKGNDWQLSQDDKDRACLLQDSINLSYLVILNFKCTEKKSSGSRKRSIILFRDSLNEKSFRLLKVRLRVSVNKLFEKPS